MTKVCTHGRGKELAMQMLEESLRRLRMDHIDVWQVHENILGGSAHPEDDRTRIREFLWQNFFVRIHHEIGVL